MIDFSVNYSPLKDPEMAITDMLNRRVRARPDDEDDVYSEQSDMGEEVSQDEAEEEDSVAADLQSDVRTFWHRQKLNY